MDSIGIFEKLGIGLGSPDDQVNLIEHLPVDFQSISAVSSMRENKHPIPFTFEVRKETVLAGIRLEGSCVITSCRTGSSHLIRAGNVYLLPEGRYDSVFGKRRSRTMFVLADRRSVRGLECFQMVQGDRLPITTVNLNDDPIIAKVESINAGGAKHSFFKFNALLSEILDKLIDYEDTLLMGYGLPQLDETFGQICLEVIRSPQLDWTSTFAAESCGYSIFHFSRTFRVKTGLGFHEFVNRVRATQAIDLVCKTGSTSPALFEKIGLRGVSAATRVIQKEFGLSLSDVRRVLAPRVVTMAS